MPDENQPPHEGPRGLCASCQHARLIESSRGATFVLCRLSYVDPRFARYPRLPVLACDGYECLDNGPQTADER